jgi:hypothetical protein
MEALFGLAIFIGLTAGVAFAIRLLLKNRKRPLQQWGTPTTGQLEPIHLDLPYTKKKYFFSVAERSFYEVLRRLVPDYTVFAKVRLADLIYVTKDSRLRQQHFNRISGKHLDFVLCDMNLTPVVAIELDDSSHDAEDRKSRDGFVNRALAAASVPIVRVRCQRSYQPNEIREALRPYLELDRAPSQTPLPNSKMHPDAPYMPPDYADLKANPSSVVSWRP